MKIKIGNVSKLDFFLDTYIRGYFEISVLTCLGYQELTVFINKSWGFPSKIIPEIKFMAVLQIRGNRDNLRILISHISP